MDDAIMAPRQAVACLSRVPFLFRLAARVLNRRRLVLLVGLAGAVFAHDARAGAAETEVAIGLTNSATDVGFFIADKRGYFREVGIRPKFITFDSAARMNALF